MRLRVLLPTEVLIDEVVGKVIAEAENGSFCLLPRHIDFVSTIVPSVLCFSDEQEVERFAAVDEGILVKCGAEVSISTLNGVRGDALKSLKALVTARFTQLDEQERKARSALARLEGGALRGFWKLREETYG